MENNKRKKKIIQVPKNKKKKIISKDNYTKVNTKKLKPNKPKKYVSKKRRKRRNRILLIISLFLLLFATMTALSLTVFFPVKNIEVVGNDRYSADEISSSIGVVKGDNLILASESRANSAVKDKLTFVKSIEFKRKFPFTLQVNVNEYQVYAQVNYNNKYINVADDGTILDISEKYKKGSAELRGVTPIAENVGDKISFKEDSKETIIKKVNKIINAFNSKSMGNITLINFENMHDIRVTYKNKIVMLLGSDSYLEQKLVHAKATLESRGDTTESGTLNLSRIPGSKNEASFIPGELSKNEIAGKK